MDIPGDGGAFCETHSPVICHPLNEILTEADTFFVVQILFFFSFFNFETGRLKRQFRTEIDRSIFHVSFQRPTDISSGVEITFQKQRIREFFSPVLLPRRIEIKFVPEVTLSGKRYWYWCDGHREEKIEKKRKKERTALKRS